MTGLEKRECKHIKGCSGMHKQPFMIDPHDKHEPIYNRIICASCGCYMDYRKIIP